MTAHPPRVEVLVLNYNGRQLLPACLDAISRQEYGGFTLTVMDNGSTDGSLEWLAAARPRVRVLAFGDNLGFAGAYDRAIRQSRAEFVALLNNDAEPDAGWLGALVGALDACPEAAAATSRIRFAADPARLNHAGGLISPLGGGFDRGFGEADGPGFAEDGCTGSPSGAACLLRREDFIAAGGFDPRYFAWFEDTDLGWRLWLRGRRVLYVAGATVSHRYGATGGGRASALRIYHCQKNRLASATKDLGLPRLAVALGAGAGYDAVRALRLLAGGNPAGALAICRGYLVYLAWLPRLLRERRRIQGRRVLSDRDLVRMGVIAGWRESWRALRRADAYRRALT